MLKLEHAVSFVTSMNKCVSTLRALQMAQQLLQASHAGAMVLLVTGETVFTVQNRILPNIAITAESAASALLSLSDHLPHQLISISYAVMGEYAGGAWMSLEQVGRFGAIFEATMLKVIKEALHKAGINFDQMVLLLPHNVNIPCWRGFAKYAQIPLEKIYLNNIAKTSHCFNSDLLINLVAATKEKYLKPGDYYVMATVGVGAMFGAAVFRY
jgi:3-oxoacyl-[acyl-carrier-protein] synthase III